MELFEAWKLLGKDLAMILAGGRSLPREQRVSFLEERLQEAQKVGKGLMGKYHPDVGGDTTEFKKIGEALRTVEEHTEGFKTAFAKATAEREIAQASKRSVFIVVDPVK